jgi:hypothetical protein
MSMTSPPLAPATLRLVMDRRGDTRPGMSRRVLTNMAQRTADFLAHRKLALLSPVAVPSDEQQRLAELPPGPDGLPVLRVMVMFYPRWPPGIVVVGASASAEATSGRTLARALGAVRDVMDKYIAGQTVQLGSLPGYDPPDWDTLKPFDIVCQRVEALARELYGLGLGDIVDALAERLAVITAIEAGQLK